MMEDYLSQSQGYFDPIKLKVPNVRDLLDELHVGKYSPTRIKYFSRFNVMKMRIPSYLTFLEARYYYRIQYAMHMNYIPIPVHEKINTPW